MTKRLITLIAISVAASFASSSIAAEEAAVQSGPTAVTVAVMGLISGGNGVLQTSGPFATEDIYSLKAAVNYRGLAPGIYTQEVKFYAPNGSLYQAVKTTFSTRRPRRGDPEVLTVPSVNNVNSVWCELPVAGGTIMRVKGQWKADVYLNGSASPIATTNFTLQ